MPPIIGFRRKKNYRPYSALREHMPVQKRLDMYFIKSELLSAVKGARVVMPDVAEVPYTTRQMILSKSLTGVAQRRAMQLRKEGSIYLKSMGASGGRSNARIDLEKGRLIFRTTDGNLTKYVVRAFENCRLGDSGELEIPLGRSRHALAEALGRLEFVAFRKADLVAAGELHGKSLTEARLKDTRIYLGSQRRIKVPKFYGREWEIRMVGQLVNGKREITASFVKIGSEKGVAIKEVKLAASDVKGVIIHVYSEIFPKAKSKELNRLSGDFIRRLRKSTHSASDSIEEHVVKKCEKHGEPNVRLDALSMDFMVEYDPAERRLVPILNDIGVGRFGITGLKEVDPAAAVKVVSLLGAELQKKI